MCSSSVSLSRRASSFGPLRIFRNDAMPFPVVQIALKIAIVLTVIDRGYILKRKALSMEAEPAHDGRCKIGTPGLQKKNSTYLNFAAKVCNKRQEVKVCTV